LLAFSSDLISRFCCISSSCGGGTRTRSASCVDGAGNIVDNALCALAAPVSLTESCNTQRCTLCSPSTCSGHGSCDSANGACTCDSGFRGTYCQVDVKSLVFCFVCLTGDCPRRSLTVAPDSWMIVVCAAPVAFFPLRKCVALDLAPLLTSLVLAARLASWMLAAIVMALVLWLTFLVC
jgi:hypothetical protein